jgi:hypothetical protein
VLVVAELLMVVVVPVAPLLLPLLAATDLFPQSIPID